MELTDIVSIISNMGFPVALCCYVIYLKQQDQIRHEKAIAELQQQHDAREGDFAETMRKTAEATTELSTLIKQMVGGDHNG